MNTLQERFCGIEFCSYAYELVPFKIHESINSIRVASAYFFLGSILITGSVHTDREKVSTKPLIILIKALNEGLSANML